MELFETAELMKSDCFKNRFIAEYIQVTTRTEGLKKTIEKYHAGTLPFTPVTPVELLEMQLKSMIEYKAALQARAELEGIELYAG